MSLPWRSIHWAQRAVHLWVFGFLVCTLPSAEWLWLHPPVAELPAPPGLLAPLTHAFATWLPADAAIFVVGVVLVLALRSALRPTRWYLTLVQWIGFSSLISLAWPIATGGQQLIANVLFWMVFLPGKEEEMHGRSGAWQVLQHTAFWVIRLQLLLAYAVTGLLKLTGTSWLAGDAVGIVSTDAAYGPAWLAAMPVLAHVVNHAVLFFQLTFPLAVWWRPTRQGWMVLGIVFHLATGFAFGIVDMGLAFLAVYPIWWRSSAVQRTAP